MKNRTKQLTMKWLVSLAALCAALTADAAGLQDQLNSMFGDMSNYTRPGVYEGQRRGVINGGSFESRSKIMTESLFSITPPSFSAGCSGIDLNGGSFSFINTDQFVQLLRSVAANAKGYAFQIALDAMCDSCMQQIENLQKKVMALNNHLQNSCQLAQGLVNDVAPAKWKKYETDQSLAAQVAGFADVFGSFTTNNANASTPTVAAKTSNPSYVTSKIEGNIVWRELINKNVSSWYTVTGDEQLMETIMSLTGTIVVGPLDTTVTNPPPRSINYLPNILSLRQIIDGGDVPMYQCNDGFGPDSCLSTTTVTVPIQGLRTLISNVFFGDGTDPGVIAKYATNTGPLTPQQISVMSALPTGMGAMIRTLSLKNTYAAYDFAYQMAPAVAFAMADKIVRDLLQSASSAMNAVDNAFFKEAKDFLVQARDRYQIEASAYLQEHPLDTARIMQAYNETLKAMEQRPYQLARKPTQFE